MQIGPDDVHDSNRTKNDQIMEGQITSVRQSGRQHLIDSIILGAGAGVFGGFLAVWVPEFIATTNVMRAGAPLLAMLMGALVACVLGPVAGIIGGLIGGLIGRRSVRSALFGTIGGLLAGLIAGVMAIWLFLQEIG